MSTCTQEYLLRYDALLELFASMRRQTTLNSMAQTVCERLRYCASVASWRLICEDDDCLIVITGNGGRSSVQSVPVEALDEFDRLHWDRRLPALVSLTAQAAADPMPQFGNGGEGSVAVVPLGERQGFSKSLFLTTSLDPSFQKLDLKFIEAAGAFFAGEVIALRQQQRLTDTFREQSLRDGLTGIANRRSFDQKLEVKWAAARRERTPVALLMIDVDHFKLFNDRFGHLAGDDCLKRIARAIQSAATRPLDLAARVGGEEFAVLLPNTDEGGAAVIADHIRTTMHRLAVPHVIAGQDTIVTLSIGCASAVPEPEQSPQALIEAADRALYAAKRGGRDRCVLGSALAPRQAVESAGA